MTRRTLRIAAFALAAAVACPTIPLARADGPAASTADTKVAARGNRGPKRALERAMPAIRFDASTLTDVIDFLSDTSGANISVDWKALEAAHVAKDAPISLRLGAGVPLRKVLSMVLRQAASDAPLTSYVDDGVIEVTSQEASDKVLISKTYPIQDLLFQATDYTQAPQLDLQNATQGQQGGQGGGGNSSSQSLFTQSGSNNTQTAGSSQTDRANEIIKLITDTVKPELWQVNGGTATINFFRGVLIVNAPRSVHELLESQY